jgi:hypothetical protein
LTFHQEGPRLKGLRGVIRWIVFSWQNHITFL